MSQELEERLSALAKKTIITGQKEYGVSLGYSSDDLENLEIIITKIDEGLKSVSRRGGRIELIEQMSRMWGVYLGEVCRKNLGGHWVIRDNSVVLVFSGISINSVSFIKRKLLGRSAQKVREYYEDIVDKNQTQPQKTNKAKQKLLWWEPAVLAVDRYNIGLQLVFRESPLVWAQANSLPRFYYQLPGL